MVNQKMQSRQGNANYVFYPLAAQTGSSCDSTGTPASSCIFYDVTVGTNAMACTTGTPNCVTNTNGDQNGVLSGYSTTAGYDQATGLGSVNVTNLVDNWSSISFQPTTATLSLSPTTITHGSAVNVNIGVRPESGSGTPTGLVSLITSAGPSAGVYTLSDGSVASTTTVLPGGSYTVTAHYAGDGTYAATESSPAIKVKVNAEPSVTAMQAFTLDQNGNVVPYTTGTYGASVIYLGTSVAGQSSQGVPTGTVSLSQTLNGVTTSLPGNPYPLNNQAYTMTPLPGAYYTAFTPGMYSFAAEYSGDASFNASNSSPMSFTVTQAQTNVTLTVPGCGSVLCVYSPNTTVSFIASIPYSSSEIISNQPTGTVTFFSNGNSLGSFPVISGLPPVADFSTNQLVGTNNVTAQYSGDTNYLGSTSSPVVVQVGGNFSISANPSVITIGSPGQSGSTTLTFNTQQGFTGSTNLAPYMCTSLPPQSSCSFSPTALAFTPSITSVPVTLTISTTGVSSALGPLRLDPRTWLGSSKVVLFWTSVICILLVISLRKNRGQPIAVFALIVMVTIGISCGGGGGPNGGSGSGGTGGTPTGNYQGVTVTVIVNGITQSISNLSVDVQ